MPNSTPASLLTIKEAARLLRVHPNTIRRWHDMGLLSGYRVGPRGDRRFKLAEIERFLTAGTGGGDQGEAHVIL